MSGLPQSRRKESDRGMTYAFFREQGINWTSFQCSTMLVIALSTIATLTMSIIIYIAVLRINEKIEYLVPSSLIDDDDDDTRNVHTDDSEIIPLASHTEDLSHLTEGMIDIVAETQLRHNKMVRDARGPSRLNSKCIESWGVESCASTMWWMCNNGDICSPDRVCRTYSEKLIDQMKALPLSYVASSKTESTEKRNIAVAAANLCNKDFSDPACGVAVIYICDQPSIRLFCQELTKIVQINYINGIIQ